MEGYLLAPPERSALIGRPVWKVRNLFMNPYLPCIHRQTLHLNSYTNPSSSQPRYVVLGTNGPRHPTGPAPTLPRSTSASKLHAARQGLKASAAFQSVDDLSRSDQDRLCLTVLKQKVYLICQTCELSALDIPLTSAS